jgi:hypothetical protein
VSGLYHITFKIIIREYGASNAGNTNCLSFDSKLVDYLSNETVDNTVCTAGAVVKRHI